MNKNIIANVNGVDILVIHAEEDDFVPITPIYEALRIKPDCTDQYIETKSNICLDFVVIGLGDHSGEHFYNCIRLKYSFAALFSLTPEMTDAEGSKTFHNNQISIYEALWDYAFNDNQKRIKSYQEGLSKMQKLIDEMDEIKQTD